MSLISHLYMSYIYHIRVDFNCAGSLSGFLWKWSEFHYSSGPQLWVCPRSLVMRAQVPTFMNDCPYRAEARLQEASFPLWSAKLSWVREDRLEMKSHKPVPESTLQGDADSQHLWAMWRGAPSPWPSFKIFTKIVVIWFSNIHKIERWLIILLFSVVTF